MLHRSTGRLQVLRDLTVGVLAQVSERHAEHLGVGIQHRDAALFEREERELLVAFAILDEQNDIAHISLPFGSLGTVKKKDAPSPTTPFAQTRPPCR